MATVNFSVPDDVKQAFNETFKDQNKSAIITELMREAIERARQRQRQSEAIDRILTLRAQTEPVSAEALRAAREEGRP
jgi:metal-responsive CopG/Arc/MetJ family transcriptional regulator